MSNITHGRASLTVTANTTMEQAAAFMDKARDGKNVYGKTDANGTITLYVKTQSTRLDVLTGRAATKQEAGREGLKRIFDNAAHANENRGLSPTGREANAAFFGSLRDTFEGGGSLDVSDAKSVLSKHVAIGDVAASIPAGSSAAPKAAPTLSGLAGDAGVTSSLAGVATTLSSRNADRTEAATQQLSAALMKGIRDVCPGKGDRMVMAMTNPKELKAALTSALCALAVDGKPGSPSASDVTALVSATVDTVKEKILQATPTGRTVTITSHTPNGNAKHAELPCLIIDGKEFTPTRFMAEGGFGEVFELAAEDGSKMAFKVPKPLEDAVGDPDAALLAMTQQEVHSHMLAQGEGHPNILSLKGVAALPNGQFGIALEFAEHGDVEGLLGKIYQSDILCKPNDVPAHGQITQSDMETIALTIFADAVDSMDHLHDRQGGINFDAKPMNLLIMKDGRIVTADFGTAFDGKSTTIGDAPKIAEVSYKAPEFETATETMRLFERSAPKEIEKKLNDILGSASDHLVSKLTAALTEAKSGTMPLSQKVDIWGLGASLLQIATGFKLMPDMSFPAARGNALMAFGKGTGAALSERPIGPLAEGDKEGRLPLPEGAIGEGTGNPAIDALINKLLSPKPEDRPSTAGIKGDPALQRPGVRHPAAYELIAAIAEKNPGKIDAARVKLLAAALPTPPQSGPAQARPFTPPTFRTSVRAPDGLAEALGGEPLQAPQQTSAEALQTAIDKTASLLDQVNEQLERTRQTLLM